MEDSLNADTQGKSDAWFDSRIAFLPKIENI